ncbi:MAG: hypothetical protein FD177_985 [Desulfovibrionaceae bacterium]|nr:MAG: hypothetical protein FD177_985 [Desulfovibrionaceae bacterium]
MNLFKRLASLLLILALLASFTPSPSNAALLMPNEGEAQALSVVLGKASAETLTLKLFTSNTTPAEGDTSATYTEAAGGGYAAINLTGASWTVTPGAPTEAVYPQQSWTFTGALTSGATIYGYYVVGATSGKVYWAERITAFTPANNGDVQRVTPKFTQE